jgi:hypothetical protein
VSLWVESFLLSTPCMLKFGEVFQNVVCFHSSKIL